MHGFPFNENPLDLQSTPSHWKNDEKSHSFTKNVWISEDETREDKMSIFVDIGMKEDKLS